MKAEIIYFSATGTTQKIVKAIAAGLECETVLSNITLHENRLPRKLADSDLVIIAFPVYGETIPHFLWDYMKQLDGNGKALVGVAVYGNMGFGVSLEQYALFAKSNNFRLVAVAAMIGQHTYASKRAPVGLGRPDDEDLRKAFEFGQTIRHKLDSKNLDTIDVPVCAIPKILTKLPDGGVRRLILQPSVKPDACTTCGACVKCCPVGAIDRETFAIDEKQCLRCYACVHICPQNARITAFRLPIVETIFRKIGSTRKENLFRV